MKNYDAHAALVAAAAESRRRRAEDARLLRAAVKARRANARRDAARNLFEWLCLIVGLVIVATLWGTLP